MSEIYIKIQIVLLLYFIFEESFVITALILFKHNLKDTHSKGQDLLFTEHKPMINFKNSWAMTSRWLKFFTGA